MAHHVLLLTLIEAFFFFQLKSVKILSDLFDAAGREALFTELHVLPTALAPSSASSKSRKGGAPKLETKTVEARERLLCRIISIAVEHLYWLRQEPLGAVSRQGRRSEKDEDDDNDDDGIYAKSAALKPISGVKRRRDDDDDDDADVGHVSQNADALKDDDHQPKNKRARLSYGDVKRGWRLGVEWVTSSIERKWREKVLGEARLKSSSYFPDSSLSHPPSQASPSTEGVASSSSSTTSTTTTTPTFDVPPMGESIFDTSVPAATMREWIGRLLGFSSAGVDLHAVSQMIKE